MEKKTKTNSEQLKKRRGITKTDVQQFLLRGRAFIALILVLVVFTSLSPQFREHRQYRDHVEACGHQCAACHWNDLCHPDWWY